MLSQFINLTRSNNFEQYGRLGLQEVTCDPADYDPDDYPWWAEKPDFLMRLTFNLNMGDHETDAQQTWEIECVGVREHHILFGRCDQLNLYNDHVLLWPYNSPTASVSFYGEAKDPSAVLTALMDCHLKLTENYFAFGQFMNGDPLGIIAGRYGVLAEGPMPLMESYAKVLESFGIGAQVARQKLGNSAASASDLDYMGEPKSAKLEILILKRSCYVMASEFNARRLA
jgi:hypothetical protein